MNDSNLMDELKALRVQEWMQRELDTLAPVQHIEEAMRTPCSCPYVEAHFAAAVAAAAGCTHNAADDCDCARYAKAQP